MAHCYVNAFMAELEETFCLDEIFRRCKVCKHINTAANAYINHKTVTLCTVYYLVGSQTIQIGLVPGSALV